MPPPPADENLTEQAKENKKRKIGENDPTHKTERTKEFVKVLRSPQGGKPSILCPHSLDNHHNQLIFSPTCNFPLILSSVSFNDITLSLFKKG
jgi:hypothetical protein